MSRVYYPYSQFRDDLKILTTQIDVEFDTILGIARGGLSMAQMLGEYYDIREVYSINTIGYEDTQKLDSIEVFNIPNLKSAKSILIVDDIVDSGETLIKVLEVIQKKYPQTKLFTASIFYKPSAKIRPNWYVKEATDWIDFFWSEDLKL